jgi:hypothetical protein
LLHPKNLEQKLLLLRDVACIVEAYAHVFDVSGDNTPDD